MTKRERLLDSARRFEHNARAALRAMRNPATVNPQELLGIVKESRKLAARERRKAKRI